MLENKIKRLKCCQLYNLFKDFYIEQIFIESINYRNHFQGCNHDDDGDSVHRLNMYQPWEVLQRTCYDTDEYWWMVNGNQCN